MIVKAEAGWHAQHWLDQSVGGVGGWVGLTASPALHWDFPSGIFVRISDDGTGGTRPPKGRSLSATPESRPQIIQKG